MSVVESTNGRHEEAEAANSSGIARGVGLGGPRNSATATRLIDWVNKLGDLDSAAAQRLVAAGLLLRVRELLLRELDAVLSQLGTSHARYQVLAIVCPESKGLQLRDIAARASVHPTTMTSTIDRLERDGLIQRCSDPKDRRSTLAVATRKGQKLYQRAHAELAAIEYGLADIDSGIVKSLITGLDEVAFALEGRAAASGQAVNQVATSP